MERVDEHAHVMTNANSRNDRNSRDRQQRAASARPAAVTAREGGGRF